MALQPDFTAVSRGFIELSDQFARCDNLPVVNEGAQVLAVLQRIQDALAENQRSIQQLAASLERNEVHRAAE